VAAFIGSPAMNLVDATVGEGTLAFAGNTIPVPAAHLPEPGRRVILGVRPDDLTLAEDGAPAKMAVPVEIVEELGAESNVIFSLDAPPVTADAVTAAQDASSDDEARLLMDDQRSMWTARLNGRRHTTAGTTVDLALDTGHLHFFDPDTGATLTPRALATV
jgi:multiple sugar transport system ATP-binding protein